MKIQPPKLAQKFFCWYCRNHLQDSILGDLEEQFYDHLERYGIGKARLFYWFGVLGFINRFTLARNQTQKSNSKYISIMMFITNIKSSFRFFFRHKGFVSINMFGLTIGLTSLILILCFINHELSFDQFHQNKANVYRVNFSFSDNSGNQTTLVNSPPAFAPGITEKFSEVNKIARLRYAMNNLFKNGDRSFYEDKGYYADSSFLEILKFPLLTGNAATALDEPNSIVISKELSDKYFQGEEALGKFLVLNNSITLKVTGVLDAIPSNSHLNFDYLISFSTYVIPDGYASDLTSWDWLGFLTYVELQNDADPVQFQNSITKVFADLNPQDEHPMKPLVQNLSDIYLGSSEMTDDVASYIRVGSLSTVYSLAVISLLILVIAGFNFANLTNAISINRHKTIGIRKVLGARKGGILSLLITESLAMALGCLVISYGLSVLVFPSLSELLNWEMQLDAAMLLSTVPVLLGIALLLGLLAGVYPAFVLSHIHILASLKGNISSKSSSTFQLKHVLLLLQFAISIGLISATLVMTQQINYMSDRKLGFEKENVVLVKMLPEDRTRYYELLKEQLIVHAEILGVSGSDRVVGEPWPFSGIRGVKESEEDWKMTYFNLVDYDYFETMGIELEDGRGFSIHHAQDPEKAVIINREAAKYLGLEHPVGEQVHFFDTEQGPRTIIGVVEDFNYTSLHQEVGPVAMVLPFIDIEHMYIRLAPGHLTQRIELVEDVWQRVAPEVPLEWRFLDDRLDHLYQSEKNLSTFIGIFSGLAVLLACLGLYGIVSFMITARIKEFGIRKVLGASILSINRLVLKTYFFQILIAMVIVIPGIHYYLNIWLESFAFRIEVDWWVYLLATVMLMFIALLTVSVQTTKAAMTNPTNSLRSE